jgi:hypothetical protein
MQPVPSVKDKDVERVVRRDFPPDKHDLVLGMLSEYATEEGESGAARVRLAILKLVAGRFDQLRSHVDMAKRDYRDVLAYAEYPNYMQKVPPSGGIPAAKEQEAIDQDWRQYEEWLKRA